MQSLTPPDTQHQTNITLQAPDTVQPIEKDEADNLIPIDQEAIPQLNLKIEEFVGLVLANSVNTPEFQTQVQAIHDFGNAELRASAQTSNRMLDRPSKSIDERLFDQSPVAKSLIELRQMVDKLDPSKQNLKQSTGKKLFGIIPFGNKIQDYFHQYESSQQHLNAIVTSLYNGKDELIKDNAIIEQEKINLWELMQSLRQYIYVGKKIDETLEQKIYTIEATDKEKARVIKEEMLFYIRQKNTDFLTQLAVNIQGYLALDMIKKNNLELIKGVDRATTTTISALRTAIMVAQALTNQKLVLDQINALNQTTSSLIESTSAMLKQQTTQTHQQATQNTIEIDKLQAAFNNIYETIDMIGKYKVEALDNMKQTVSLLSQEVDKANNYLDKHNETTILEVSKDIQSHALLNSTQDTTKVKL